MIDIHNFTQHSLENFDLNLLQKEVDGGVITTAQIDEISKHPDAKSIIISGLKQDTFEYLFRNMETNLKPFLFGRINW